MERPMKITLRLSEPVTQTQHQQYILGAAMKDVSASLMMFSKEGAFYLPKNPFTFNAEGTALEGEIKATVPDMNMIEFKQSVVGTMNNGLRGNTTKIYEPAADFPRVQVKV